MAPIQIPLTQEQFDAKAGELRAQNIQIEGTSGTINRDGVLLDWAYDGATLTITVQKKPFVLGEGFVAGKIRGWFS